MKWRKLTGDTIESSDERYCVMACTSMGTRTGRYIAFRGKTGAHSSPVCLGGFNSQGEAQRACRDDAA